MGRQQRTRRAAADRNPFAGPGRLPPGLSRRGIDRDQARRRSARGEDLRAGGDGLALARDSGSSAVTAPSCGRPVSPSERPVVTTRRGAGSSGSPVIGWRSNIAGQSRPCGSARRSSSSRPSPAASAVPTPSAVSTQPRQENWSAGAAGGGGALCARRPEPAAALSVRAAGAGRAGGGEGGGAGGDGAAGGGAGGGGAGGGDGGAGLPASRRSRESQPRYLASGSVPFWKPWPIALNFHLSLRR